MKKFRTFAALPYLDPSLLYTDISTKPLRPTVCCWQMVLNLSDSKSPQAYWTLLNILADLCNVLIWMVSIRPLFSDLFKPTIYYWYRSHFYAPWVFSSLARSKDLSLFSISFIFTLWSTLEAKSGIFLNVCIWQSLFFLFFFFFFFFFFG